MDIVTVVKIITCVCAMVITFLITIQFGNLLGVLIIGVALMIAFGLEIMEIYEHL